jgi:hypothetical protein
MRWPSLFLFISFVMLAGCSKKQDFDTQYNATDAKLKADMKRLDRELDTALKREPGEDLSSAQKDTQH